MKLSIIIVSYNTITLLEACLSSLVEDIQSSRLDKSCEIIVIDNNSADGSSGMVQKKYPDIILVRNKKNVGFAKANNQGIGLSKGVYIMLLNSDTMIKTGSIARLLSISEQQENAAVVGPKLLNQDGSIQYSAGFFPSVSNVLGWMFFVDNIPLLYTCMKPYHADYESFYHRQRSVDWVSGACMVVSKKTISKAGLLDDEIFMYGEEVEWCFRIKKTGGEVMYIPDAEIVHLKGGSSLSSSTAGILEEFSFILYFFKKHRSTVSFYAVKFVLQLGALLRILLFGIIGRHQERIPIYAKALQMVRR